MWLNSALTAWRWLSKLQRDGWSHLTMQCCARSLSLMPLNILVIYIFSLWLMASQLCILNGGDISPNRGVGSWGTKKNILFLCIKHQYEYTNRYTVYPWYLNFMRGKMIRKNVLKYSLRCDCDKKVQVCPPSLMFLLSSLLIKPSLSAKNLKHFSFKL